MWATIGAEVVKKVFNIGTSSEDKKQNDNFSVQGHFDGKPLNMTVNRDYQQKNFNNPPSSNCSKGTTKKRGNNNNNKDNHFYIKCPSNADFELHLRKGDPQVSTKSKNNKQFKNGTNSNNKEKNNTETTKNKDGPNPNNKSQFKGNNKQLNMKTNNYVNKNPTSSDDSQKQLKATNYPPQNMQANNQKIRTNKGKTWMYIGRLKLGTSETDVHSYLSVKFPKNNFKIEQLPPFKNAKLPSFKVEVDNEILEEFQDASHWPCNVTIKLFNHNFKT